MEANAIPVIIPVWLTGFDQVMPEGRRFPYKYMPRLGASLSVTFGDPLSSDEALRTLGLAHRVIDGRRKMQPITSRAIPELTAAKEVDQIRSEITDVVRLAVVELGRKVSGPMLSL